MKVRRELACFFLILLVCKITPSINAKSIEKAQSNGPDYYNNVMKRIDDLKNVPLIGMMIEPYVSIAENTIDRIDDMSGHNLSAVYNSIMPCNLSTKGLKCEGKLDKTSLRNLVKTLLSSIPPNLLPPNMASMVQLLSDIII